MKENNMRNFGFIGRGILFGIGALAFAAMIALLFGWILMLLWNWLMPALFSLPVITYWQGWGLILLSHLLFKGGGHGGPRENIRNRRNPHSRSHLRNKEDIDDFREEFRSRMKSHWHDHGWDYHDNSQDGETKKTEDENSEDKQD